MPESTEPAALAKKDPTNGKSKPDELEAKAVNLKPTFSSDSPDELSRFLTFHLPKYEQS